MQLVIRDANQGPFLSQVLRFGRDNERLESSNSSPPSRARRC